MSDSPGFISIPSESLDGTLPESQGPPLSRNHIFHHARLYHGTSAELQPGDSLTAGPDNLTFSTPNIEEARRYAAIRAKQAGVKGSGHVYEVATEPGDRSTLMVKNGSAVTDKSGKPYIVSKGKVSIKRKLPPNA